MQPGNSRNSFHKRFARASSHCGNSGQQDLIRMAYDVACSEPPARMWDGFINLGAISLPSPDENGQGDCEERWAPVPGRVIRLPVAAELSSVSIARARTRNDFRCRGSRGATACAGRGARRYRLCQCSRWPTALRPPASDCRNAINFDIERAWPGRHMNEYACRRFVGKIARIDFVEDAKMRLFRRTIHIAF
jgi:hypothetical protein